MERMRHTTETEQLWMSEVQTEKTSNAYLLKWGSDCRLVFV